MVTCTSVLLSLKSSVHVYMQKLTPICISAACSGGQEVASDLFNACASLSCLQKQDATQQSLRGQNCCSAQVQILWMKIELQVARTHLPNISPNIPIMPLKMNDVQHWPPLSSSSLCAMLYALTAFWSLVFIQGPCCSIAQKTQRTKD